MNTPQKPRREPWSGLKHKVLHSITISTIAALVAFNWPYMTAVAKVKAANQFDKWSAELKSTSTWRTHEQIRQVQELSQSDGRVLPPPMSVEALIEATQGHDKIADIISMTKG